jgi:hypothetical protein
MKDADVDKLHAALRITINLEAQLKNFQSRGGRAGKNWTLWLKDKKRTPEHVAAMKPALTTLAKMAKDAKVVLKDLDKATKDAGRKDVLAKYATGKEYRDKVLVKQLASVRTWDQDCAKFIASIGKCVPPFPFPAGVPGAVDEKVTYEAMKNYQHYFDEMQKELAKLG